MLKSNVQEALNNQMNADLASAYLYLSMAAYFDANNFRGMAAWMKKQSDEEWKHAGKFYDFLHDRGGRAVYKQVDAPKAEWGSVLEVFEDAYKHECKVTGLIHALAKLAAAETDFATQTFLQWFISEQVEEEAQTLFIVDRLKMMGDGNIGLFILDGELGKRA
jgi:ferritin